MRWHNLALVLVLAATAHGAERYLSPAGDDAAAGTREQPWKTLAKANAAVQPGDTVILLDGSYPSRIEPGCSGAEGRPITFRAAQREGAVITGEGGLCLRLIDRTDVVIEGLRLEPTTGSWARLERTRRCVLRGLRMENATASGSPIECRECHHNRYEDLVCERVNTLGSDGLVSGDLWNNYASTHNVWLRCRIGRCGHRPLGLWFDCPYNVIRDCVFDGRWGRDFEFFSTPRLLMEGCVVTNGLQGASSADGRAKLFVLDSIVRRNLICRNAYGPMVINAYTYEQLPTFGMLRSRVYHNTFTANADYGFEMVDLNEHPDPHFVAGNVFQNNLFAGNDRGGDGLALLLYSNIGEDNRFVCNDLYGRRPGDRTVRYDWSFPGVKSWPGKRWTAEEANAARPAQFVGNVAVEPRFVDSDRDDYRLRPDSPARNAGRPLAAAREDGRGNRLPIDDARWFYDGFGIAGERGDTVLVGPRRLAARVVQADIEANVLTLDRALDWRRGDAVTLPYTGAAPDLGAYEQGAERDPAQQGSRYPAESRIPTMATATRPVVTSDFEADDLEAWHYWWNTGRQRDSAAKVDDTTAASGKRSLCVYATGDRSVLSADVKPPEWDLDRFPFVHLAYRIPPGVPVGLWVYAFASEATGTGAVCLGGTASRAVGAYGDLKRYTLTDDDAWHEVTLDARAIREVYPQVQWLKTFRLWTLENGKRGQRFWFDDFRIEYNGRG